MQAIICNVNTKAIIYKTLWTYQKLFRSCQTNCEHPYIFANSIAFILMIKQTLFLTSLRVLLWKAVSLEFWCFHCKWKRKTQSTCFFFLELQAHYQHECRPGNFWLFVPFTLETNQDSELSTSTCKNINRVIKNLLF